MKISLKVVSEFFTGFSNCSGFRGSGLKGSGFTENLSAMASAQAGMAVVASEVMPNPVSVHRTPHLLCRRALEVQEVRLRTLRLASAAPCKHLQFGRLW